MNRSKVFTNAHQSIKASQFTADWSNCLINAYNVEKERMQRRSDFIAQLKGGIVAFKFTKSDGSIRFAFGTLSTALYSYEPKGSGKKENVELVRYFDLEKGEFRSFKFDSLIEVLDLEVIGAVISCCIGANLVATIDLENNIETVAAEVVCGDNDTDIFVGSVIEAAKETRLPELELQAAKAFFNACQYILIN